MMVRKRRGYCDKWIPLDFTAMINASEKLTRKFINPIPNTPPNTANMNQEGI
jgi:hypothetical protein